MTKKIDKKSVQTALENIVFEGMNQPFVTAGLLKNIVVFGSEIVIDLQHPSPSLQAKRKVETQITTALKNDFGDIQTKINISPAPTSQKPITTAPKLEGVQNVIAIASGKGGVGKSTITANLAVSLAQMGFKVGVLDADVYGPSIHLMFDATDEKPRSVNIDGVSKIKPIERYGIKLLSLGFFTGANQAVIWRGPMASKALNQLIFDAAWGALDFLLLDLPPGTGDVHLSMVQALPITGAVVVSTPQNIALADARKGIAMFQQDTINVPVLGLIENMSYFTPAELPDNKYYIFGKDGVKNLCRDSETAFLGEVPLVQSIRESADVGRPSVLQENTPMIKVFKEITQKMLTQLLVRNRDLPPTEIVKITNMSGCSAPKK